MAQSDTPRSLDAFYSREELAGLGLKSFGTNVLISRKASLYRPDAISLGNNVRIDDFALLTGGAGIVLGDFVHIAAYAALLGGAGITMENFVGVSLRATVLSESDDFMGRSLTNPMVPLKYKPTLIRGPVVFRKHSGIGINSTVFPGVEIGEGGGLGGYSMTAKNCEPWTVYVGAPAKRSVRRRRDIIELERQFMAELAANTDGPTAY